MIREIDGFLAIDKPPEMSSARITAIVKKLLGAKKVGHTGTLDPFATGVMLLCLGKATKLARFFLQGKKTYEGILKLGIETDTQDLTGRITAVCDPINISKEIILDVFRKFEGTIQQYPPVFSALKHNGAPLYKLARMGKPFQKPARTVHIYDLDVSEIRFPEIKFRVTCSAGTYIRTLVADIGKILGCGGHLKALKRTQVSIFKIEEAVSLQELEKTAQAGVFKTSQGIGDYLIPMTKALKHMPEYIVGKDTAEDIVNGRKIHPKDLTVVINSEKQAAEDLFMEQAVEKYAKVVNNHGRLLAILSFEKNCKSYKYCCVFPD
jgi:tRNA pseudouridine55 synthase